MGMSNRQRRQAKAKQRARQRAQRAQADTDFSQSGQFRLGAAILALRQLVLRVADNTLTELDVEVFAGFADDEQQHAIDSGFEDVIGTLFNGGWTPSDLREFVRRKLPAPAVQHALGVAAELTARHSSATVHPAWAESLRGVEPAISSRRWAQHQRLAWRDACRMLVELLALLISLPKIEEVLPLPGSPQVAQPAAGIDERMLRKVRALLAKAEATEHEEEADALTAKAQQLMTAYSIERSLAEAQAPQRAEPVARRMWIDAPYVEAKSTLINDIAMHNLARCVLSKQCGFVTLIGFPADLDTVELLATSLLVQATRAMTASGSYRTRYGTSRTRSFRQSFLLAFAQRIGERLREAIQGTVQDADAAHDGTLLPVLASRAEEVEDAAARLFPRLTERPVRISNAAGWGAGRAAADLAVFDIHAAVTDARAG